MTSEASDTLGQQYKDNMKVGSSDKIPSDSDEDYICSQTGEEFSAEFLRDRTVLRRIPVMTDVDQHQLNRLGYNFNQNHQLAHEDLTRILNVRRTDSDAKSDLSEFAPATGHVEAQNWAYPSTLNRNRCEHGGIGHLVGNFSEESYCDQVSQGSGQNAIPIYPVESPQSCLPYVSTFSDDSSAKKIKCLCSFGGTIWPRPNDGRLRYVGGETRIISLGANITWEQLMRKTYAICNQIHTIKYQLPGEDLDALISVSCDEDLLHMIEEYEELERAGGSQRLRIFLIPSSEPESPSSIDAKAIQPSDTEYQYVVAVNGMLNPSSRNSSYGQSLASQTSQYGNTSDYNSPSFCIDTSPSAFAFEAKESIPKSNLAGTPLKPDPQFYTSLLVPGKSFNQSYPISPVCFQHKEPIISDVPLFLDQPSNASNESSFPFVMDKVPCDNSLYSDNTNYIDPIAYYSNLADGHPIVNYHPNNQYVVDADLGKKPDDDDVQSHKRSHSKDSVSTAISNPIDMMPERLILTNEGSYYFDNIISYPEESSDFLSVSAGKDGSHFKLLNAPSDPQLQENDERSKSHSHSSLKKETGKLPSLKLSSSIGELALNLAEVIVSKNRVPECEIMPTSGTTENYKGILVTHQESLHCPTNDNTSSDCMWRRTKGNAEETPCDISFDIKNLQKINYQLGDCSFSPELHSSKCNISDEPFFSIESPRNLRDQPHDQELDIIASEFLFRSQNSSKDLQYAMLETENSQPPLLKLSEFQPIEAETEVESIQPIFSTNTGAASQREGDLLAKDPENYPSDKDGKPAIDKQSCVGHNFGNLLNVQSQPSDSCQGNENLEPIAIVKGQTDCISSTVQPSSKVASNIDEVAEDASTSSGTEVAESANLNSESEVVGADGRDSNENVDVATAEKEAEIYGLQIIKNADLEDLLELGSGTFGTVYHGHWRGTDVAIKRIKSSCFSGRFSEQERLTKDFWREAQILSTLHHPNVVAFYGVVADGPGGRLATVTEYMINGSLRNVLLRKEKVLDRRKRLIIAMDAAFGMEYLHLKNIVHFDLKCENLLVNLGDLERPVCKVGDFGLSRIKRNTLVSGGVRGTLPWMAPELLDGNRSKVSEKVDIFSFGITMWEILTGEEPYENMHCGEIIGGIVNNTLRPPIPKRCDAEWKKMMEDCWNADPAARPGFTEVANRLRNMLAALPKRRHNVARIRSS
ncbi:hypothetical protein L6164_013206 [Bauhinia variegata]|uniref:Uncharacterized protein n=1 Tax=Bauhinia variegata TaxID=167791 RepID=A0ACB9PCK1_BAUVA|nr:hypothetical protein L6164_013206 [Bauhinia variegata]